MQEEQLTNVSSEVENDNTDYIATIQQLKQNSVDKAKYDDLRLKNKQLLEALANGQQINVEESKPKKTIDELRKAVNDENQTNLSYFTNVLDLRDALIAEGSEDPFVPTGLKISATDEDRVKAQRVADGLRYMVDIADGNPDIFNNEYQRLVKDTVPFRSKK